MGSALITGLIGLIGVLAGVVTQRFYQQRKFLSDGRYEAYILFLKSLAGSGATEPGSDRRWEAVSGMIKSRIALFGSEQVVSALSEFSSKHRRVNDENFDGLARTIALMRDDVGAEQIEGLQRHIRGLLFEVGS